MGAGLGRLRDGGGDMVIMGRGYGAWRWGNKEGGGATGKGAGLWGRGRGQSDRGLNLRPRLCWGRGDLTWGRG